MGVVKYSRMAHKAERRLKVHATDWAAPGPINTELKTFFSRKQWGQANSGKSTGASAAQKCLFRVKAAHQVS